MTKKEADFVRSGSVIQERNGKKHIVASCVWSDNGVFFITVDGDTLYYKKVKCLPDSFSSFTVVYGYNFTTEQWIYDCKYYLKNGVWYKGYERPLAIRNCSNVDRNEILKIVENNPNEVFNISDL